MQWGQSSAHWPPYTLQEEALCAVLLVTRDALNKFIDYMFFFNPPKKEK